MSRNSENMKMHLIELFEKRCGYTPNLEYPKTFCEKHLMRKLGRDLRIPTFADKSTAKLMIKGLSEALPIPKREKVPLVMKPNNASGCVKMVYCVEDFGPAFRAVSDKLHSKYGLDKGEWWYGEMKPVVVLEQVLPPFYEFKFFCFHGKVHYIWLVEPGTRTWFTRKGQFMDMRDQRHPIGSRKLPDVDIERIIRAVETLSKPFDHVRVDMYYSQGTIYFGEFTFAHQSGMTRFSDPNFDRELGGLW